MQPRKVTRRLKLERWIRRVLPLLEEDHETMHRSHHTCRCRGTEVVDDVLRFAAPCEHHVPECLPYLRAVTSGERLLEGR